GPSSPRDRARCPCNRDGCGPGSGTRPCRDPPTACRAAASRGGLSSRGVSSSPRSCRTPPRPSRTAFTVGSRGGLLRVLGTVGNGRGRHVVNLANPSGRDDLAGVRDGRHRLRRPPRRAAPARCRMEGPRVGPRVRVREDRPPGKVFGAYEESKAEAERHVAAAYRQRGLPAITLIPGVIMGPGDTRNTGKYLLSFVNGEWPGTFAEESFLPVVDVDDVARAHLLAYERGRIGERYIISGEDRKWGDLIRVASSISGTPVPSRHIGGRALWLASRAGEAWAPVTRASPQLPAWLADF